MLINKTEKRVTVIYNGKSRDLDPGDGIDIRDFDISNKDVSGAEKHIMAKHPGRFDLAPNMSRDPAADRQTAKKIKDLEDTVVTLTKELSEVRASEKIAKEKFSSGVGEVATMEQKLFSMKMEVDRSRAEKKDMEDEIEKLREQAATSKRIR